MVNAIDNESRNRANMMPVGIKVVDDKGNAVHTAKTDLGTNYISLESKWFGSSSNNNGGNNDPDNPIDNGVNYVPGLLTDGTLTGRKLQWSGTTNPDTVNTLSFNDDLGTNLNLAGDGLQFVPYLTQTLVTRGVEGESANLPLTFNKDKQALSKQYSTTQYLPVSINRRDLINNNEVVLKFDGVVDEDGLEQFKAPEMHIKYNSGKNSTDVSFIQGYAYDNLTDTKTGEKLDLGISEVNTFYTQSPVAQYPSTVQLFSGQASGTIILSGVDNFYSNISNGIELTIDNQIISDDNSLVSADCSALKLSQTVKIPKEFLIIGNKYNIDLLGQAVIVKEDKSNLAEASNVGIRIGSRADTDYLRGIDDAFVLIESGKIEFNGMLKLGSNIPNSGWSDSKYIMKISKVTPY